MQIRITCIKKNNGDHENPYLAITHLGWVDSFGKTGMEKREDIYNWIENGGYAYVKEDEGIVAQVITEIAPSGTKYVRTKPDSTTKNNLLNLRECK